MIEWLYGVKHRFQQYFSYIAAVVHLTRAAMGEE